MIQRERKRRAGYGFQQKLLKLIPENLRQTYKQQQFYWDDSGKDDPERILIFTTQQNIDN